MIEMLHCIQHDKRKRVFSFVKKSKVFSFDQDKAIRGQALRSGGEARLSFAEAERTASHGA